MNINTIIAIQFHTTANGGGLLGTYFIVFILRNSVRGGKKAYELFRQPVRSKRLGLWR